MRPSVDELHEALFGYRPNGLGKSYERLAAIVFAYLGCSDVLSDTIEGVPGRRAKHQIDVRARRADGQAERTIIECKDWDKGVGKATLDAIVGVRAQLGADLAIVVTTERFTRGARAVAVDEGVRMLRLQPVDPDNPPDYVGSTSVQLVPTVPQFSDVGMVIGDNAERTGTVDIRLTGADHLLHVDGSEAERIQDLMVSKSVAAVGRYERRADFPDGRLIPVVEGAPMRIDALTWVETVVAAGSTTVTVSAIGSPKLVAQELDGAGNPTEGCVIVDTALNAWYIDSDGRVLPQGNIGDRPDRIVTYTNEPPESHEEGESSNP
jgi:hypothetical protein